MNPQSQQSVPEAQITPPAQQIPLTKGKFALVDNEDFEKANQFKWFFSNSGYAMVHKKYYHSRKQYTIHLSRLIINAPEDKEVDHINGNKLDNRKANLRIATRSQNAMNSKIAKSNTSGYKGVSWFKRDSKWRADIRINYKSIFLGLFTNKKDAVQSYNQAAKQYFGEFARLNTL